MSTVSMFSKSSRTLVILTTLALVAGCAARADEPTTSTSTTTTITSTTTSTTLPPTTTTTLPPFTIEGAPAELTAVVETFYDYVAARVADPPRAPDQVLGQITPVDVATPLWGVASVATFAGQAVATVETGDDLFLAVDDGSGWRIVGGSWPALGVAYFGEFPRLVAVIGSDARPGENVLRSRGDSLQIVGLDGAGGGGIVGIPRDSYVPVPGIGRRKINAALALGGPEVMFATLRDTTGLPLEGYVLTGFEGFMEMVGHVLGGMDVEVPFAIADTAAGAFFEAGLQYLNGPAVLALARPRKTLPGGDFARSQLQGLILVSAAKGVRAKGFGSIPQLLQGSEPWLFTNLSPEQLLTFAAAAVSANLDEMRTAVAPGRPGWAGGASVVFLSSNVSDLWADLADGRLDHWPR